MKVTKPYRIWLKYNNFRQKSTKISQKTPILAFLGQFFRFSREIFEFGIFHMAYPKTTDKNQALRKNPCPKKPLQLKLWFFLSYFLPKTSIFGRFCSEKSEIDFFLQQIDNVISYGGLITIFITNPKKFFSKFLFKGIWWRYSTIRQEATFFASGS